MDEGVGLGGKGRGLYEGAIACVQRKEILFLVTPFIISPVMTIAFSAVKYVGDTIDDVGPVIVYVLSTLATLVSSSLF